MTVKIGSDKNNLQAVKAVSLAHAPVKANVQLELVDMGNGLEEDYTSNPGKANGKIAVVYLGIYLLSRDSYLNYYNN